MEMQAHITREQFEQAYAARSGITVERLKEQGREAVPCDCHYEGCTGWQMAHVRNLREDVANGIDLLPSDQAVLDYLDKKVMGEPRHI